MIYCIQIVIQIYRMKGEKIVDRKELKTLIGEKVRFHQLAGHRGVDFSIVGYLAHGHDDYTIVADSGEAMLWFVDDDINRLWINENDGLTSLIHNP